MRVRFSTPVGTGYGIHPACDMMRTGSFSGINDWGVAEVKERVELYIYSSSGPSLQVIGES
jgi:hypothetical protein